MRERADSNDARLLTSKATIQLNRVRVRVRVRIKVKVKVTVRARVRVRIMVKNVSSVHKISMFRDITMIVFLTHVPS
jgi:hypothetical protein